jgi:hypothetical protein
MSSLLFLETESFASVRRDIAALRADIESSSAQRPMRNPRDQIGHFDARMLLLELRHQNSRAKLIIEALSRQVPATKRVIVHGRTDTQRGDIMVEIYEGFRVTAD